MNVKWLLGLLLLLPGMALAQDVSTGVEARADQVLQEMSSYLAARPQFSFRVEAAYDEELSGRWIEYTSTTDIMVRRPDAVCAWRDGDKGRSDAYFNGKELVIHSPDKGFYSRHPITGDIPTMLDFAHERLDMTIPVADFLFPEPYKVLTTNLNLGLYVGLRKVDGVDCHHLFFATDTGLEWQIWIEAGKRRVPRKLLLRYANEPGAPQYGASFSEWDFNTPIAPDLFDFAPQPDDQQIEYSQKKTSP